MASPEPLGADAFLPALTEELIWSPDIGETQLDVEFLMELLDPEELLGEGESPHPQKSGPNRGHPKQPHLQQEERLANCGGLRATRKAGRAAPTPSSCP